MNREVLRLARDPDYRHLCECSLFHSKNERQHRGSSCKSGVEANDAQSVEVRVGELVSSWLEFVTCHTTQRYQGRTRLPFQNSDKR